MNSKIKWLALAGMAFGIGHAAPPKNIILMISDGWGYNQMMAADYYKYGAAQASAYRGFPVALPMSTYSAGGNGFIPDSVKQDATYIKRKPTDSAASGTAIATGIKTYDAGICVDMDSIPLVNIADRAEALGKSAGVVTSVEFSHATPASMVAHNISRNNYAAIANEMIFQSGVEVMIGAGHPEFNDNGLAAATPNYNYVGGQATWDALKTGTAKNKDGQSWSLVETKNDFAAIADGTLPAPDYLVGVAQVATTLQQARSGGAADDVVGEVPFNSNVPDLATLSQAALQVLKKNPQGFFLMVEGGAVDWAGHANQSARSIEEQMDFNVAVDSVIAWIGRNGGFEENLLIVTGDHETGYLTGADAVIDVDPTVAKVTPVSNNGQGVMPGMKWNSGDHTNQLIPLYAQGAGSSLLQMNADEYDSTRGHFLRNSEIGQTMLSLWPATDMEALKIPRYTFLLISDGAGFNSFGAADLYQAGQLGVQSYNNWPMRTSISTFSTNGSGYAPKTAWADATYVKLKPTDSAASGTAFSTGVKTYDAAINVDMAGNNLKSIVEAVDAAGLATGVVTSVEFSHATPAAMVAHNASRNNYAAIANEMLTATGLDVIMGAGHPEYNDDGLVATTKEYKYVGGQATWEALVAGTLTNREGEAWNYFSTKAQFDSLATLDRHAAPTNLVGVPMVRTTLQQARSGGAADDVVGEVPFVSTVPDLATMTKAAINTLDKNPKGFFVMVEGGAVDWAGHANQAARLIEEQLDFNRMVDSVVAWIDRHDAWDESLVMVTADHETGYVTGPTTYKLVNKGKGKMPGMKFNSGDHTNQLVPFFAKGVGVPYLKETTDNFDAIRGYHSDNAKVGQVLQRIYADGIVPADRIESSSSSTDGSSSSAGGSSSSAGGSSSSSSTDGSSSSAGGSSSSAGGASSSSGTTALAVHAAYNAQLHQSGNYLWLEMKQSGYARVSLLTADGTRLQVLANGYVAAGSHRYTLGNFAGAVMALVETEHEKQTLRLKTLNGR